MITQKRLVGAIKSSGVSRIAIIDDAFDVPMIAEGAWGQFLDFFTSKSGMEACVEAKISDESRDEAIKSINETEFDNDDLLGCVALLYKNYMLNLATEFDPGGLFKTNKGANLTNVLPVIKLLKACMPDLEILTVGSVEDGSLLDSRVDVVFVDLFLDPTLTATDNPDNEKGNAAVQASLNRIAPFLASAPSVILMSSHLHSLKATDYRASLKQGVFASRFTFIAKTKVQMADSGDITLEEDVAEALLDIFQSYKFSRGLDAFLGCWTASAKSAVETIDEHISNLDLREIAYLVQFRLAGEGQNLPEYLEWFLGETLLDKLCVHIDGNPVSSNFKNMLSPEIAGHVESAFDGPTDNIAKMYHRVRVDSSRPEPRRNFRMGDLYIVKDNAIPKSVLAIMNPDCDLILRPNGKRAIDEVLMVVGELQKFDAPQTSAGDYLLVDDVPFNINWRYKKVRSFPFSGFLASPGLSVGNHMYAGALKPLYAQEIQRNLLHTLGRVGVYVPPAIAISAAAKVEIKSKTNVKVVVPIGGVEKTACYFFPSRGGTDKGVVVFKRSFISGFMAAIQALQSEHVHESGVDKLNAMKEIPGYEHMLVFVKGIKIGDEFSSGILVTDKKSIKLSEAPWCWISISIEAPQDLIGDV
ncbi:hypothetical protein [Pseudomonas sp. MWU12-2037]|uniref:hypothetical protein n=1 Tax=Pseudomonas sp. MWU12-2037 TaxID=2928690 RepID=UPI00200F6A70|nr:hypothetical protein [Pseudomonas sp. MWU12-2037]